MTVFNIINSLPKNITWTLIKEDYNSDRLGTTIGTITYSTTLCYPQYLTTEINKALDCKAVSIDLVENVIFYTEEEINK